MDTAHVVERIIDEVGPTIVLAIPLGIGKPNRLVNALYQRAKSSPELSLTIYTALSLNAPRGKGFLEKRFLAPFCERVFGNYANLDYEEDRNKGAVPKNVHISEFYFPAGRLLNNRNAQENYISSNYTHVARDLLSRNVNVVAQIVSPSTDDKHLSLSCNPDVSLDLMSVLRNKRAQHRSIFVAEVNRNLPYMHGDALVPADAFDIVFENDETTTKLFGPPKTPVSEAEYMIGMYSSMLVKDGGELQIGIGALSDALVYGMLLRQESNDLYQRTAQRLGATERFCAEVSKFGGLEPFEEGLFSATEMFVDVFMFLIDSGIIKRRVYDHVILQRLINEKKINSTISSETLYELLARHAIEAEISEADFEFLQHFGIFRNDISYADGIITNAKGESFAANLNNDQDHEKIISSCLGSSLKNGAIMHAGFFLGPQAFYDWLRNLPEETRQLIHMKSVSKINQLYGHEELDRLHRKDARFINTCLYMTLFGGAVSDGLEDARIVSGVGGQYNFVAMAQELPDGHSILQLRSTRQEQGKTISSIVFNYAHITIPRHLRDIVVTEYGIADIRGKTDAETAKALINIADSRFQESLLNKAKKAGKVEDDYQIPTEFRNNFPQRLSEQLSDLRAQEMCPPLPFGSDFTAEELRLGRTLKQLKKNLRRPQVILPLIAKALFTAKPNDEVRPCLVRMGLDEPRNAKERFYRRLLIAAL